MKNLTILALLSILTLVGQVRANDDSIMLEIGWKFGVDKHSLIDFGAIRYRNDDRELHVAGWKNTFAVGLGYALESDGEDAYVSFTPGISYVSTGEPVRAFYRAAVGYEVDDHWAVELGHTAYMPFTGENQGDAFGTVAVRHNDKDKDNGRNRNNGDSGSAGDGGLDDSEPGGTPPTEGNGAGGDEGGNGNSGGQPAGGGGSNEDNSPVEKPGHGYGDPNATHTGPPGQN